MKKNSTLTLISVLLSAKIILSASSSGPTPEPWLKENVSFPMLNMEIRHSLEEQERQKDLKESKARSLGLESSLSKSFESVSQKAVVLASRLEGVALILEASPIAYQISREAQSIYRHQEALISLSLQHPTAGISSISAEAKLLQEMEKTLMLLVGLSTSVGVLNAMQPAERKILLDFALSEVRLLEERAYGILARARNAVEKQRFMRSQIRSLLNRDRALVAGILKDIKALKS